MMGLEGGPREDVDGLAKVRESAKRMRYEKVALLFALPKVSFRSLKLLAAAIILLSEFCMEAATQRCWCVQ